MELLSCILCFYLEVGAGHKVAFDTSSGLYTSGRNPTAHLAAGATYFIRDHDISLDFKYEHMSHWRDGWPANDNWEWHVGQFKFVIRKYLN